MKKQHFVWLAVFAILITAAFLLLRPKSNDEKNIKIGADITLTGGIAYWGQQIKKGLDIAVLEANKSNSESKIEVIYQDNKGKADQAISIFRQFAEVEKVACVISIFTPVSKPLRPIAEQAQTPLLATVVSAADFGLENEWSFRDFPSQTQQATELAAYLREREKIATAATLVVTDDYGRDGEKIFVDEFKRLGGSVLASEYVDQDDSQVRDQAEKLLKLNPDCIFIVVRDSTLGIAVKQIRELGYKGKIAGVNAFDAPVVWETAGEAGQGCIYTSASIDFENNEQAVRFREAFRLANDGEDPDWVAVYGYTIGQYLIRAARTADGDPVRLREELAKIDEQSIRGQLQMNEKRDIVSPIGVFIREGNSSRLVPFENNVVPINKPNPSEKKAEKKKAA